MPTFSRCENVYSSPNAPTPAQSVPVHTAENRFQPVHFTQCALDLGDRTEVLDLLLRAANKF